MKQLLLLLLLFSASLTQVASAPNSLQSAPDVVIITNGVAYLTADVYMSAQWVQVDLLNASGNVQATTTMSPGNTVSFQLNDSSRKLRSTYHLDSGQEYVIVDELSM